MSKMFKIYTKGRSPNPQRNPNPQMNPTCSREIVISSSSSVTTSHERELREGLQKLKELRQSLNHEVHPITLKMSLMPPISNDNQSSASKNQELIPPEQALQENKGSSTQQIPFRFAKKKTSDPDIIQNGPGTSGMAEILAAITPRTPTPHPNCTEEVLNSINKPKTFSKKTTSSSESTIKAASAVHQQMVNPAKQLQGTSPILNNPTFPDNPTTSYFQNLLNNPAQTISQDPYWTKTRVYQWMKNVSQPPANISNPKGIAKLASSPLARASPLTYPPPPSPLAPIVQNAPTMPLSPVLAPQPRLPIPSIVPIVPIASQIQHQNFTIGPAQPAKYHPSTSSIQPQPIQVPTQG